MRVRKHGGKGPQPAVVVESEVLRQIRQHARSCSKAEVCGVLIGSDDKNSVVIEACIAGANAAQAGTHVTFTQDTWAHIYQTKDAKYPDYRIVGWYHSHPGFGVFLSDHDTFIHKNFFSSPLQVAWVYDPHSDEEGCFGWVGQRLERLNEISVLDHRGGEGAGETGKPEPVGMLGDAEGDEIVSRKPKDDDANDAPAWFRITLSVVSYTLVLVLGFLASWVFFPHKEMYFIDTSTGLVYEPTQDGKHLQQVPGLRVGPGFAIPSDLPLTPGPQGSDAIKKDGSASPANNQDTSKEKNVPRQK
ncbi:MAG TPA: Mov34/MPN/PAD-1 family protein [Candidatus Acidoferrum sp.]|nr:Mov34/MPN/PAD-1 family protein [Candidatus Acidoferrum sp.]